MVHLKKQVHQTVENRERKLRKQTKQALTNFAVFDINLNQIQDKKQ